jgi:NAD(P)-dependent dehydrogenase (short-subunit alcohol dehydrogenase family)
VRYRVRAALTNKNQQGAYRGFGSEVNNWMLEQMVDKAARELGLDPVAVRRMNFIRDFPHFIPTGNVYDSGDYERVLDHALELARYDHWRDEQRRLREQGRYVGIGVITAQERSVFSATEFWFWFDEPGAPVTSTPESVSLKVDATGGITAVLYSCAFWGNSPETMVAQLVAEEFDCSPYDVSIVYHGSRDGLPATGPGGSRTTVMLAGAVEGASAKIKEKARRAAAHLLEIGPDDLEWADGGFRVRGDPERKKTLGEIAIMLHLFKHSFPEDMESGLDASKVFDHPYTTMPSADRKDLGVFYPFVGHACHVPVVEVDIETGSGHVPELRGRARLRDAGQPAVAGRAHRRRHGPGHRHRPVRGVRLRRRRPAAVLQLHGLPDTDRDGGPRAHHRPRRDAVAVHAARHQGRRRGRPDDGSRRHQRRGKRRARPARGPADRAADDAGADPGRSARRGSCGVSAPPVPVAVVTGANRGIGRAITVALAAAGYTVAASARDPSSLSETVAEAEKAGGTAVPVGCDVCDEPRWRRWPAGPVSSARSASSWPTAGIAGPTAPLHEITLADWRETIATDLDGVFLTFRAFIPAMVERRDGSLIAISSMTGKRPLYGRTPYAAAKMGVIGLVRTLATELGPLRHPGQRGLPGLVAGPGSRRCSPGRPRPAGSPRKRSGPRRMALSPLRRLVTAEEVAAACVFLASPGFGLHHRRGPQRRRRRRHVLISTEGARCGSSTSRRTSTRA